MLDGGIDIWLSSGFPAKHASDDFLSRECGESERPNKLLARVRHDDLDTDASILQEANDFSGFVCGDAAADCKCDFHTEQRAESCEQRAILSGSLLIARRSCLAQPSWPRALSSVSAAASTGDAGISGTTHFTLPALISSWAIRQGLRDCVSITGGAPPWSWRARRAATR